MDENQEVTTDPEEIKHVVFIYFQQQARPPSGQKNGLYLPGESGRDVPWNKVLVPFQLEKPEDQ